jgi:hypothetical protein
MMPLLALMLMTWNMAPTSWASTITPVHSRLDGVHSTPDKCSIWTRFPRQSDTSGDCFVLGHDVVVDIQCMKYNEPERSPFVARAFENAY